MEMNLEGISKNYFYSLNVLAQKIVTDIKQTQEAYQDFWQNLSRKEQEQVIDESIINPAAVLKYSYIKTPNIPLDERLYSWFTQSQLDLTNQVNREEDRELLKEPCGQVSKNDDVFIKEDKGEGKDVLYEYNHSLITKSPSSNHKQSVLKPKNPPPPPPKKIHVASLNIDVPVEETTSTESGDIPKTGFDFLDNW